MNMGTRNIIRSTVLICLLSLSACGFQPLYATRSDGSSVSDELVQVSVQTQTTRVGQLVRNEIVKSIRPAGHSGSDKYQLKLLAAGQTATLINTSDTVHRRLAYNLTARFSLVDLQSQQVVFSGSAFSKVPYDRLNASFANVQARVNAEEQAAAQVGQEIRTRLAAHLASN